MVRVAYGSVRRAFVMEPAKLKTLRHIPIKSQKGFTLNEVLIAVALIAIGVLGFSMNTAGVIRGNQVSGSITIATNLAQEKLEELKAQTTFTNVTNAADPNNPITATGGGGGIGDRFTRTWTIKDSTLGSGLKEISVDVSWTEYLFFRNVVLATLVFTG